MSVEKPLVVGSTTTRGVVGQSQPGNESYSLGQDSAALHRPDSPVELACSGQRHDFLVISIVFIASTLESSCEENQVGHVKLT